MRILIFFILATLTSFSQGLVKINSSTYLINSDDLILNDMDLEVEGTLVANGLVKFTNGDFTMNGDFDSGTGKFIFTNTTSHDHYLSTSSDLNNVFYDLTVQGSVGTSYDLHLLSNIKVNNHLEIQSQKFNLSGNGIDLGTTGHLYYEGDGQFLYDDPEIGTGYIQASSIINSSTTSNPGNLGLEITTHSNQMGLTTIKRYHRKAEVGGGLFGSRRIFDVTPTYNGDSYGGNLNVDLKFIYFGDILEIEDVSSLKIYRSGDGGITWENKGGTVDVDNGLVTVIGFNEFSQVTIGPDNSFLPVELLYFDARECEKYNILKWSTASEKNSSHFSIQWSIDGINWREIGTTQAAGNSNETQIYYFNHPISHYGFNYYRLLQYDFDGNWDIYGPILIENYRKDKFPIKYMNTLGQEILPNSPGIIFKVYSDGTMSKTINN